MPKVLARLVINAYQSVAMSESERDADVWCIPGSILCQLGIGTWVRSQKVDRRARLAFLLHCPVSWS